MTAVALPTAGPPEQRGRLTITKRVVGKIATQASSEVSAAASGRSPKVDIALDRADAWLDVEVGLAYPTPLRAAAEELRAHLIGRVERLTGLRVRRVDITVSWLTDVADLPKRLG